jgi:hypothetical protein
VRARIPRPLRLLSYEHVCSAYLKARFVAQWQRMCAASGKRWVPELCFHGTAQRNVKNIGRFHTLEKWSFPFFFFLLLLLSFFLPPENCVCAYSF